MLVLSRRIGEEIVIADHVRLRILDVQGKRVRVGISAPESIAVHRDEIQRKRLEFEPRAESTLQPVPESG